VSALVPVAAVSDPDDVDKQPVIEHIRPLGRLAGPGKGMAIRTWQVDRFE
jgi:hypothetical protein